LTKEYDIILLSTSFSFEFCNKVIKKYNKNSIILLLVSYISDETVTIHIKNGAKDYIMKPFIIDELLKKIYHYKEFRNTKRELQLLKDYFKFTMLGINTKNVFLSPSFPILIETNSQKYADKLVYELSIKMALPITFISLSISDWHKKMNIIEKNSIVYLTNYHTLKKYAKENLIKTIKDKNCVISSLEQESDFPYQKIEVCNHRSLISNSKIMPITDYVKTMVVSYQDKYSDSELSRRLGISRKSLWEKRKRLDIEKRK
jgi:DNA-binding NtrC family response regulator